MAVDLKQVSRRLLEEAFGNGNIEVLNELCDAGFKVHDPLTGDSNLEQEKENIRNYRTAFPDLKPTILNAITEGDTVVTHWRMTGTHQKPLMDIQPTGKRVTVEGLSFSRFRGGKIAEEWAQWDALGMLRQLGVAPPMSTGASPQQQQAPRPRA